MEDIIYLHCLNLFPRFGPKRLALLEQHFKDFTTAWNAPPAQMVIAGVDTDLAKSFAEFRTRIIPEAEATNLDNLGIHLLARQDKRYPVLLAEITPSPQLLYYRGHLPTPDTVMLAAVGTRNITTYGRSVAPLLLGPLVDAGIVIVSGLAFGVDALAHKQAIERQKPTVAVLGSGIDDRALYPKAHALLAQEIIDTGGALLSEYPPGTPGFKQNFIARNRIISGLCVGALIIECDLKSGSLITAQYALEQNRRVYAVPGPIYANQSRGPNNLLKMGAQAVTAANDILSDLNIDTPIETNVPLAPGTPAESLLLGILSGSPTSADILVKQSGLETRLVMTTLSFLEMKGRVNNVGANQYVRIR